MRVASKQFPLVVPAPVADAVTRRGVPRAAPSVAVGVSLPAPRDDYMYRGSLPGSAPRQHRGSLPGGVTRPAA